MKYNLLKLLRISALLSISFTFSLFPIKEPVYAQITISDTLSGILEGTTYNVVGDVFVNFGDTLIIEAGAVFLFDSVYSIRVYGHLFANGTSTDSIYFMPSNVEIEWKSIYYEDWGGIGGELNYCHITGCSGGGVNVLDNSEVIISNCTITGNHANWGGGIYVRYSEPLITDCLVSNNWSVNNGGGIYISHASPVIINCVVTENVSDNGGGGSGQGGGGICANHDSHPTINDCIIYNNSTFGKGGGLVINDISQAVVQRCQIYDNYSELTGGGVFISFAEPLIKNCTIYGNTSNLLGGGITVEADAIPVIKNTIISSNLGEGGILIARSPDLILEYCDIFDNANGNIIGDTIPEFLGQLTTVNANGDSCDIFYNIFADPGFTDPLNKDFSLLPDSRCIDAGDPGGTYDPDGTAADMGALFYPQGEVLIYDLTVEISGLDAVLHWLPVAEASAYNIYRSEEPYFDYSSILPLAVTGNAFYSDPEVFEFGKYFYKVTWE